MAKALRSNSIVRFAVCLAALAACSRAADDRFSGTVQAPSAAVGSPIGGRIVAVLVQDGQRVRTGSVIVRFDDEQQRAALDAARHQARAAAATLADLRAGAREADLARARDEARQARETFESASSSQPGQIAILQAELAAARAQVADALAEAHDAHVDAVRTGSLSETGDVSAQARDAAAARAARAAAQLRAAEAGAANARERLAKDARFTLPRDTAAAGAAADAAQNGYRSMLAGSRPDTVRAAEASLAAAQSGIASARARLADTIVRAPAGGVVSALDLHPGDLVAAGSAVATIDEDGEPYVRIYVPQSRLGRVTIGTRVAVHPDSEPAITLQGTVEAVDEQAQFTPLSVQTEDDRAALSFGIKVRIHDREHPVHGGTTATVSLS